MPVTIVTGRRPPSLLQSPDRDDSVRLLPSLSGLSFPGGANHRGLSSPAELLPVLRTSCGSAQLSKKPMRIEPLIPLRHSSLSSRCVTPSSHCAASLQPLIALRLSSLSSLCVTAPWCLCVSFRLIQREGAGARRRKGKCSKARLDLLVVRLQFIAALTTKAPRAEGSIEPMPVVITTGYLPPSLLQSPDRDDSVRLLPSLSGLSFPGGANHRGLSSPAKLLPVLRTSCGSAQLSNEPMRIEPLIPLRHSSLSSRCVTPASHCAASLQPLIPLRHCALASLRFIPADSTRRR